MLGFSDSVVLTFCRSWNFVGHIRSNALHVLVTKNNKNCHLKIHGIDDGPLLLELVSYDTVKTLRGVLANLLKVRQLEKMRRKSAYKSSTTTSAAATAEVAKQPSSPAMVKEPQFSLYMGIPRHKLTDDSLTLGDLGLAPNGVLHVSKR